MVRQGILFLAVIAAAGIIYVVSQSEPASPKAEMQNAGPAASAVAGEVQQISLKVPGMHCPFACYPSVKETLEGQAGVQGVDLAAQKEEGAIDNPVVIICAGEGFDLDAAIAQLAKSGFSDASVVQ